MENLMFLKELPIYWFILIIIGLVPVILILWMAYYSVKYNISYASISLIRYRIKLENWREKLKKSKSDLALVEKFTSVEDANKVLNLIKINDGLFRACNDIYPYIIKEIISDGIIGINDIMAIIRNLQKISK